jgi:hypothetical protein
MLAPTLGQLVAHSIGYPPFLLPRVGIVTLRVEMELAEARVTLQSVGDDRQLVRHKEGAAQVEMRE